MNKKGIMKIFDFIAKILSYLCLIVLFLIAIFLIFYIVSNHIARINNKAPIISLYTIVSPSMEPKINVYDVIIEFRVNENDLKVGDVITFYSNVIDTGGYTVTHRIKEIQVVDGEKRFITKGDNNSREDEGYITIDDIVGRVHYILPGLGRIQFFISSKLGWLVVILIPALGIIIMDIIKLRRIFKIKQQIEEIPQIEEIEKIREKEENKHLRALIEKANKILKK